MSTETAVSVTYYDGTPDAVTFTVGDYVIVHDPSGDLGGVVETVTPEDVYIQGPPLGGNDSRSWHWRVSYWELHRSVSKVERARGGETP